MIASRRSFLMGLMGIAGMCTLPLFGCTQPITSKDIDAQTGKPEESEFYGKLISQFDCVDYAVNSIGNSFFIDNQALHSLSLEHGTAREIVKLDSPKRLACSNDKLYIAFENGSVAQFDIKSNTQDWLSQVAATSDSELTMQGIDPHWEAMRILLDKSAVYVAFVSTWYRPSCWLAAISRTDGSILWKRGTDSPAMGTSGVTGWWGLIPQGIITTVGTGLITLLDHASGEEMSTLSVEGTMAGGVTHISDNSYLLQTAEGYLYSFAADADSLARAQRRTRIESAFAAYNWANIQPISLGDNLAVCRVSAADALDAPAVMTLGLVDIQADEIVARFDTGEPLAQPLLITYDGKTSVLVASERSFSLISLDSRNLGKRTALDLPCSLDAWHVTAEPCWCEEAQRCIVPTSPSTIAVLR